MPRARIVVGQGASWRRAWRIDAYCTVAGRGTWFVDLVCWHGFTLFAPYAGGTVGRGVTDMIPLSSEGGRPT